MTDQEQRHPQSIPTRAATAAGEAELAAIGLGNQPIATLTQEAITAAAIRQAQLPDMWQTMLEWLREHLDPSAVAIWLEPCEPVACTTWCLKIETHPDARRWVADCFARAIAAAATHAAGRPMTVRVIATHALRSPATTNHPGEST